MGEPTTEALREEQRRRERAERRAAGEVGEENEARKHERRADRAAYLREKLAERAEAEDREPRDGA